MPFRESVWQATRLVHRAVKENGISDDDVLDAFFSSPVLCDRLLTGRYSDGDYARLVDACRNMTGGVALYSPGAFAVLMIDLIADVSCEHGLDPSALYRSCRDSGICDFLRGTAVAFLHDGDQEEYDRVKEQILSLYGPLRVPRSRPWPSYAFGCVEGPCDTTVLCRIPYEHRSPLLEASRLRSHADPRSPLLARNNEIAGMLFELLSDSKCCNRIRWLTASTRNDARPTAFMLLHTFILHKANRDPSWGAKKLRLTYGYREC